MLKFNDRSKVDNSMLRSWNSKLRVLIVTVGTRSLSDQVVMGFWLSFLFFFCRGDVQPFLAIAALLIARGADVGIATHEDYRGLVEGTRGCSFFGLDGCPAPIMREFMDAFAEGSIANDIAFTKRVGEAQKDNMRKMWDSAVAFKPTFIVSMMSCHLECISIATRLGIPSVVCTTYPLYPSSELTPMSMMSNEREFPLALSQLFSSIGFKIAWTMSKDKHNEFRASIGLDPLTSFSWDASPIVNLYSALLAPRPSDWPSYVYDGGFCFLEDVVKEEYEPDPSLADFLRCGAAPIYFGFGSMPTSANDDQLKMFAHVCAVLGRRGVVFHPDAANSSVGLLGENLFVVGNVPHWWLFPQCCAIVCHGGAGTTASALKAGIPCKYCS